MVDKIPFNKPYLAGRELEYIGLSHSDRQLAGDGGFTTKCHQWLEKKLCGGKALLTHSCTAALEMSALLLDIQPGDEIIMPSYTFVSTANAFVLRGGVPVFVDIRFDTANLDETLIEASVTKKTKAIVVVHYAGVSCEMDQIMKIAKKYGIAVVEDAAQGVMANYKGVALGGIGDLGTYSFHETKNVISGEGGALLINKPEWQERAEILREKGTNRTQFFKGKTDKYTWQDIGSSFLPGEIIAAFLWAQLECAQSITKQRLVSWNFYHELFSESESLGMLRRPIIPLDCEHNAHMYYILLQENVDRRDFLSSLSALGVDAVFHYVPLHSSPAGSKFGRVDGELKNTDSIARRLVRLPLWIGISEDQQCRVFNSVMSVLGR